MKLKLTKDDKKALLAAAIILMGLLTIGYFISKYTPIIGVTNPN
jgi:hypothetical protein